MSSPWKRVDLFSLSSVTSAAAAARRRTAAAAGAASAIPSETPRSVVGPSVSRNAEQNHSQDTDGKASLRQSVSAISSAQSLRTIAAQDVTRMSRGAPSVPEGPPAATVTRVSISRLLSRASLTWRDSLACFVELTERDVHNPLGKAEEQLQDSNDLKAQTRCGTVPLEAIVSLFATLQRREGSEASRARSAVGSDDGGDLASLSSAEEAAQCELTSMQHPVSSADLFLERSRTFPIQRSRQSLSTNTLPLRFLAYAAQHHAGLQPICSVLAEAFTNTSHGFLVEPQTPLEPEQQCLRDSGPEEPLPTRDVEDLTRLLSVSTILHVGLGKVLRWPPDALFSLPESSQERWAALRVLGHLERYGGACDYLAALCDALRDAAAPSDSQACDSALESNGAASHIRPNAPEGRGRAQGKDRRESVKLHQQVLPLSAQLQQSKQASQVNQPVIFRSEDFTKDAHAIVRAAARLQPNFCCLFQTLQAEWEARNAHQLRPAAPLEANTATDNSWSEEDLKREDRDTVEPSWSLYPPTPAEDASADDADAVVDAVRSLARATPSPSAKTLCKGNAFEGAAMSTPELTRRTLEVVHFAWGAMEVVRRFESEGRGATKDPMSLAARTAEAEALFLLLRTASRFSPYADLRVWLDGLLPPPLGPKATLVALETTSCVSAQQRAALLCLLSRAVQRAPSWAAVCALLREIWPRMPSAPRAEERSSHITHGAVTGEFVSAATEYDGGFASCPLLLEAFFDTRHSPSLDELSFWCGVVCTPACIDATHSPLPQLMGGTAAGQEAARNTSQKQDANFLEWSRLLYGSENSASGSSLNSVRRQHATVTAAAAALVRQWLRPVAAFDSALDCLATCHARCAERWAAAMVQQTRVSTSAPIQFASEKTNPSSDHATVFQLGAVAQLVHQHRVFSSTFLTPDEQFNWFNLALCRTQSGMARQLLLRAAMEARWSTKAFADTTASGTIAADVTDATPVAQVRLSPDSSVMLVDLTRVFERWISASENALNVPAATERTIATFSLLSGASFTRNGDGCLGEVGKLFNDVATAMDVSFPAVSTSLSALPNATSLLLAVVRRGITLVGLRWERQQARHQSSSEGETQGSSSMPLLFGTTVLRTRESAPSPSSVTEQDEVSARTTRDVQRARLREWLNLLCTCPPLLMAHEGYAVVWLYVLMRQVEEVHAQRSGGGDDARLVPPLPEQPIIPSSKVPHATTKRDAAELTRLANARKDDQRDCIAAAWSVEEEEATVRRATAALCAQLWSVLPPSSLLPPMLLNWLLTRGGVRSWGEAVSFLRGAAAAGQSSSHPSWEGKEEPLEAEDDRRRYLYLVLPLDRVTSMGHAIRVLRTLQVVEERYKAADADVSGDALRRLRESALHTQGARCDAVDYTTSLPFFSQTERQGGRCSTSMSQTDLAQRRGSVSTLDKDSVVDLLVQHQYYPEIERVLLREWYRRALAAVLDFVTAHPESTFLTPIADAPDLAAVGLREQVTSENIWSWSVGAAGEKPEATLITTTDASVVDTLDNGDALLHQCRSHSHQNAKEMLAARTICRRSEGKEKQLRANTEPSPSPVSTANATSHLRIPLHFLGSFILEESSIGNFSSTVATAMEEAAQQALMAVGVDRLLDGVDVPPSPAALHVSDHGVARRNSERAAPSGARQRLASSSSILTLLEETHRVLFAARDSSALPPKGASNSTTAGHVVMSIARRTNAVDPELVRLFMHVLQIKKAEASRTAEDLGETVEDAVCAILSSRSAAPTEVR